MSHETAEAKKHASHRMDGVEDSMSERFESLKSNFAELRGDMAQVLKHIVDTGKSSKDLAASGVHQAYDAAKDGAQRAYDATKDGTQHAYDAAKDKASGVRDAGQDALDSLAKQIRSNPGTSALIAFSIGFVVAKVLRRT